MICGFNCVDFETYFGESSKTSLNSSERQENDYNLKDFIVNNKIDVGTLQEKLFSINQFDVFISHSHKDYVVAQNLKHWLEEHLGLESFLDSDVWGSADAILKQIDNSDFVKHGTNEQNGISYSYADRNLTTSYVYVMLCNAIMQAMDSCSFVFFLNTPNSIDAESSVKDRETNSPWLYYELSVLKYIQKKEIGSNNFSSLNEQESRESFFKFPAVDLINIPNISYDKLISLKDTEDVVYQLKKLGGVI